MAPDRRQATVARRDDAGRSAGPTGRHRIAVAVVGAVLLVFVYVQVREWVDRTGYFVSALGLVVVLLLLLDWVADLVLPPAWRVVKSVGPRVAEAVSTDPEISRLLGRTPRLDRWLRARLSKRAWHGLYLTVTVLVALWFLWLFVDAAWHLAFGSALVAYDPGIAGLLHALRTPQLTRVMWVFTLLGDPLTVLAFTVLAVALLTMWGRYVPAAYLAGAVATGSAVQTLAKSIAHRPRPGLDLMLIANPETWSFPSGHATSSLLLYGAVGILVAREFPRVRRRLTALTLVTVAILMVGVSRVYLGVHWPTDVYAGWFLGAFWLAGWTGALVMFERYGPLPPARAFLAPPLRAALTAIAAVLAVAALVYSGVSDPVLQRAVRPAPTRPLAVSGSADTTITLPPASVSKLPRFSEKLDGSRQEPIGIVFIGTRRQLVDAFARAGWSVADQATVATVMRASVAALLDERYPTGPVTPTFLDGRVQDIAFEKETARASARSRHHTRFWLTHYTAEGVPIWVATASLDEGIAISSGMRIPSHRIAPNIDAERDYIVRDLKSTGLVLLDGAVRVSPAISGTNAQGDTWFTQGLADVMRAR